MNNEENKPNARLVEEAFDFCIDQLDATRHTIKRYSQALKSAYKWNRVEEFNRISKILQVIANQKTICRVMLKEFNDHKETCFSSGSFCVDCVTRAKRLLEVK